MSDLGAMARKVVSALIVGLMFYAMSDILLWQRIFESHDLFQYDMQYQTGHLTTLVAMLAIGVILLWDKFWSVWYALAFYTLTFSGLEDVLYYWLDGKSIPATLPWLDGNHSLILFHPITSASLLLSAAIWIAFWAGTVVAIRYAAVRKPALANLIYSGSA